MAITLESFSRNYITTQPKPPEAKSAPIPIFHFQTETKAARIAKQILSVIIFPLVLWKLVHILIGKFVVPASVPPSLLKRFTGMDLGSKEKLDEKRAELIRNNQKRSYKTICLEVDGYKIDAMLIETKDKSTKDRWILKSNGNMEYYEHSSNSYNFETMLDSMEGNALIFNYPGVGRSEGPLSRELCVKAYRAALSFLETEIKAKEIIGYGHSLGGAVQAEALENHELKKSVKYLFIKSRTFSSISDHLSESGAPKILTIVARFFGWNMSTKGSKNFQAPEIIMQTANVREPTQLESQEAIENDGVLPRKATLAYALLQETKHYPNKLILGIPDDHNYTSFTTMSYLANVVKERLCQ